MEGHRKFIKLIETFGNPKEIIADQKRARADHETPQGTHIENIATLREHHRNSIGFHGKSIGSLGSTKHRSP